MLSAYNHLPVCAILPQLRGLLQTNNTVLLQAAPGAGKSTVVPVELLDESWLAGKKIIMMEPRRLAARTVADRLAANLGEATGKKVGYRVRFDTKVSEETRIEVVTEGILTRMIQRDSMLEDVGLVIFDEFHERSLQADMALALVREIQKVLRDDLRILIMSATLALETVQRALDYCPVLVSEGRQFSVRELYEAPDSALSIELNMIQLVRKAVREQEGDVLAFLPGVREILQVKEGLEALLPQCKIYPLYGELSQDLQQQAIVPDPNGYRKIILATSIAETSITIEGVKVVVDSGQSRVPRFDPRSGLTKLETIKVTLDSAEQRKGRAGRVSEGVCYRLWSQGAQQHLVAERKPEILEADLSSLVLEIAGWSGVKGLYELTWVTPPPKGSVQQAAELLTQLQALDGDRISSTGKKLLRLPTHPRIAHLLEVSAELGQSGTGCDIAAILEEKDMLGRGSNASLSERVGLLRAYRKGKPVRLADKHVLGRIERLAASWRRMLACDVDNSSVSFEVAGRLLAAAYPERIARKTEGNRYKMANGRQVKLGDNDPLITEQWLAVAQADAGSEEGRIFLAAPFDPGAIEDMLEEEAVVEWDYRKGELIADYRKRIGALVLGTRVMKTIPEDKRVEVLCQVVEKERGRILDLDSIETLQARVGFLRKMRPGENWPDFSTENLIAGVRDWLPLYAGSVRKKEDFQRLDMEAIVKSMLPWDLQSKLDVLAPVHIEVPSGSMIRIAYQPDAGLPVLAVRLQEMFGLGDTPTINEGRTTLLLHLLSPGYKPVQVTQDLKSFWKNTYPEVKKELKGRYPKHHWPDDPWTAEAVRGIKRKNV